MNEPTSSKCKSVGALTVDGRRVGWLRCALPAGHERGNPAEPGVGGDPHSATLEWSDDAVQLDDWPEAYDEAEHFDVVVPAYEPPASEELAASLVGVSDEAAAASLGRHALVEPPAPERIDTIGTCLELRPGDNAPCLLPNAHLGLHAWPIKLYG